MTLLFADGADLAEMRHWAAHPRIAGFTTNPTLMRRAGVAHYETFAREAIEVAAGRPISFEVLADDWPTVYAQARKIASWAANAVVKIPVTDSHGGPMTEPIGNLAGDGIPVNVTAICTSAQVETILPALGDGCWVSVFAGRIADTGRDPVPVMREARWTVAGTNVGLIWASPREILNVTQAEELRCHAITLTGALLAKLDNTGLNLDGVSLATVRQFYADGHTSGMTL